MNKTYVTTNQMIPLNVFMDHLVQRENAKHGPGQFSDDFLYWMRNGVDGHSSDLTEREIFLMRWAFDAGNGIGYTQGANLIAEGE
jgi:hypothetical protein